MSQIDDGGPVHPTLQKHGFNSGVPGMTLRDHFAGLAMQGELAAMIMDEEGNSGMDLQVVDSSLLKLTKHWYRIADFMLKARNYQ